MSHKPLSYYQGMRTTEVTPEDVLKDNKLEYIVCEITNVCNLICHHCLNKSGPHRAGEKELAYDDWVGIMNSAAMDGCRSIQFFGGEPLSAKFLPALIEKAKELGFTEIEVFTNATLINEKFIAVCKENDVKLATTLYSNVPEEHDEMTSRSGSHVNTVRGITLAVQAGIRIRVNILPPSIDKQERVQDTVEFVKGLGVTKYSVDDIQPVGRGKDLVQIAECEQKDHTCDGLCGHCWKGSVCITPHGETYPCSMARTKSMGNISEASAPELFYSEKGRRIRGEILAWAANKQGTPCPPNACGRKSIENDDLRLSTSCPPNPCGRDATAGRSGVIEAIEAANSSCPPNPCGRKGNEKDHLAAACPPNPCGRDATADRSGVIESIETVIAPCPPNPCTRNDEREDSLKGTALFQQSMAQVVSEENIGS